MRRDSRYGIPQQNRRQRFRRLLFESLDERRVLAAVHWDGGGDGTSWLDPRNRDTDVLPGPNDDVLIDSAGDATVVYGSGTRTVRSLQSAEALVIAGGTLTVNGPSVLAAGLRIGKSSTRSAVAGL
jgi:hypothetical protein